MTDEIKAMQAGNTVKIRDALCGVIDALEECMRAFGPMLGETKEKAIRQCLADARAVRDAPTRIRDCFKTALEGKETVMDIAAELREISKMLVCGYICQEQIAEYADRLEVAHDREQAKLVTEWLNDGDEPKAGNTEALRTALERVDRLVAKSHANCTETLEISNIIVEALVSPPRNCDLFGGDYKMLHTAWRDWTGSPSGMNADGTARLTFGKWLLEFASRKGGAA